MLHARDRAKNIRLICLDVDGVLTDGGLYYDGNGIAMKRFDVQDGLGIKVAQSVGIQFAVISGLKQKPVAARVQELGIEHYHPGHHRKIPLLQQILDETELAWEEVCYVGDDWVDVGCLKKVGLAVAVPGAVPEVLELAHMVTKRPGGRGAVRETIEFILKRRGLFEKAWGNWAE